MTGIIIAAGPVIVERGKVLLNRHGDTPFWKFCGGRVEDFSTNLKENARREAKEEVGIDLVFLPEEPFFFYTQKETPEGMIDVILVHYLAERRGEVVPGPDIREAAWIDLISLKEQELGPNILPTLRHFHFV
jgi:ADP-ribose pyrophosphatase YjhB (NUDIX family)